MNRISKLPMLIKYFKLDTPQQFIGRWTITGISNSSTNIDKIIDRNNTDHCGICIDNKNIKKKDDKKINYLTPFFL